MTNDRAIGGDYELRRGARKAELATLALKAQLSAAPVYHLVGLHTTDRQTLALAQAAAQYAEAVIDELEARAPAPWPAWMLERADIIRAAASGLLARLLTGPGADPSTFYECATLAGRSTAAAAICLADVLDAAARTHATRTPPRSTDHDE